MLLGTQELRRNPVAHRGVEPKKGGRAATGSACSGELRAGQAGDVVFMHLGTNGYLYGSGLHDILQETVRPPPGGGDERACAAPSWMNSNNHAAPRHSPLPQCPAGRLECAGHGPPEYLGSDGAPDRARHARPCEPGQEAMKPS